MKTKLRSLLAVIALAALSAGTAAADPIGVSPDPSGSSVSASLGNQFCLGCSINVGLVSNLGSQVLNLDVGDSATFNFFWVQVGAFLGGAQVTVQATLALTSAYGSGSAGTTGHGGFASAFGVLSAGYLHWNNPAGGYTLSDGSYLGVIFHDVLTGGLGNSTKVKATVYRKAGETSVSVPEPGTMTLLGFGLLGLWFASRRRQGFLAEGS